MSVKRFKNLLDSKYPNMQARRFFLKRRYYLRTARPDWKKIISKDKCNWEKAHASAKNGRKILIGTSIGGHLVGTTLDSILSAALTLRGAEVHVVLCDDLLPACLEGSIERYPELEQFIRHGHSEDLCKNCFATAYKMFSSLGVRVHRYSELVSGEELSIAKQIAETTKKEKIGSYKMDGLSVGEHALAGALRFFGRGVLIGVPGNEEVMRRYFHAALLANYATRRILRMHKFESVVTHHGIYVPHGLIVEAAREANIRVVTWIPSYRKRTFIFSHDDTYHHTLMHEPTEKWEDIQWNKTTEKQIMDYLESRRIGKRDWIWFHEKPEEDIEVITRRLGIDVTKPCIGMLTNVVWDAQLHYPANVFPNMLEWVIETIRYFSRRLDLQVIIRVHPAEIRGALRSFQPTEEEIRKIFPVIPENIFIISAHSNASTYAAMEICDAVVIYGTKTGVELASYGIPVIVAGEAWIRNKGVTMDASTVEGYYQLLDKLPLGDRLGKETIQRARKYAYHFFYRRMIPLEFVEPVKGIPLFRSTVGSMSELAPDRSVGLDVVCNGILRGDDFIYPSEDVA